MLTFLEARFDPLVIFSKLIFFLSIIIFHETLSSSEILNRILDCSFIGGFEFFPNF